MSKDSPTTVEGTTITFPKTPEDSLLDLPQNAQVAAVIKQFEGRLREAIDDYDAMRSKPLSECSAALDLFGNGRIEPGSIAEDPQLHKEKNANATIRGMSRERKLLYRTLQEIRGDNAALRAHAQLNLRDLQSVIERAIDVTKSYNTIMQREHLERDERHVETVLKVICGALPDELLSHGGLVLAALHPYSMPMGAYRDIKQVVDLDSMGYRNIHYLGFNHRGYQLTIRGNAGNFTGACMQSGKIVVEDTRDFAFAYATGGEGKYIDAGNQCCACLNGANLKGKTCGDYMSAGMKSGRHEVETAQKHAGYKMEGGLARITATNGEMAGYLMKGGTMELGEGSFTQNVFLNEQQRFGGRIIQHGEIHPGGGWVNALKRAFGILKRAK